MPLSLPNALSILRLTLVALAWIPALAGHNRVVAVLAATAGATDILDGMIARAWHQTSRLGSHLDSIADLILILSILAWLWLLRPEFLLEHREVLAGWVTLGAAALVVGLIRFRRVGDLHLRSTKVAGALAHLFVLWLLFTGSYPRVAFTIVIAVCFIATTEVLLVLLLATPEERRARPASILPIIARVRREAPSRGPRRAAGAAPPPRSDGEPRSPRPD